ncbi:MAG TPA: response regulator [Geobacteraceae bacterium]|nr:response regulator [Geobacteraceae bacterium]
MDTLNEQATPTILVIDDEKSVRDLVSIIIASRGYNVASAEDAVEGMKLVAALRPDLVLMDYMMPGVDGLTALGQMRAEYPDTYVIMFTGKGSEEIAVALMKGGASDYILKPFNNQNLVERIENVLKIRGVELKNKELLAEREKLLEEIKAWNLELEQRIQKESEDLRKAHAEVVQSQKLATLGYLAAGMAHEIRNPLNTISLFVQLLREGLDDPEKLEYVEKILREVDRVDDTLRKLLHTAKRPMFELSDVDVEQVIRTTLDSFRPQTAVHRIAVEFTTIGTPPPLKADPEELKQIFTNLVLNAIHEMPDGGRLGVELYHDGNDVTVLVSDTGSGIPRENLPSIFDPFFTTKSRGTGMGLAVVLRIVKNYGGRIEVANTGDSGTVFLVSLPIKAVN